MVAIVSKHDVMWLTPSPLWHELDKSIDQQSFIRPSILRFNQDDFMDQVMSLLYYHPERLIEWQAIPETWREPMPQPTTAKHLKQNQPLTHFSKRFNKLDRDYGLANQLDDEYQAPNLDEYDFKKFKLYQPAQMRYYLVTASLVCRRPGLPDRKVDDERQEQVGFVIRRVVNKDSQSASAWCDPEDDSDTCYEYAFVQTPDGPRWKLIDPLQGMQVDRIEDSEERLPMFSLAYQGEGVHERRLLAGMIPVARRDNYMNTHRIIGPSIPAADENESDQEEPDPRVTLFEMDVAEPWKAMLEQAVNEKRNLNDSKNVFNEQTTDINPPSEYAEGKKDTDEQNKRIREQIQTISWYVLLDFERYLHTYLLPVWEVLKGERTELELTYSEEHDVIEALKETTISLIKPDLKVVNVLFPLKDTYHSNDQIKDSLFDALLIIARHESIREDLEAMEVDYDRLVDRATGDHHWPNFLFPLADPEHHGPAPDIPFTPDPGNPTDPLLNNKARIDALVSRIDAALQVNGAAGAPEVPSRVSPVWDKRDSWFVIRCFYERPNCGPFHADVLSKPTRPFQMASFFDPDAPSRPVKIFMPEDISPAGLRKHSRNTTFMISDMLCGKLKNMRRMTLLDLVLYVLPWPFHKGLDEPNPEGACGAPGNNFGMFCSLSIPIVTLCAMVLLIIMVTLFDIFFRWLPLLFVCLPIPGLKGKKS